MIQLHGMVVAATCLCISLNASVASAQTPRERLEETSELECVNYPLRNVADHLSKLFSVNIELARAVNADTLVTTNVKGKLKEILKHVLLPLGLNYSVNQKRILIYPSVKLLLVRPFNQLVPLLKLTPNLLWVRSVGAPIVWLFIF